MHAHKRGFPPMNAWRAGCKDCQIMMVTGGVLRTPVCPPPCALSRPALRSNALSRPALRPDTCALSLATSLQTGGTKSSLSRTIQNEFYEPWQEAAREGHCEGIAYLAMSLQADKCSTCSPSRFSAASLSALSFARKTTISLRKQGISQKAHKRQSLGSQLAESWLQHTAMRSAIAHTCGASARPNRATPLLLSNLQPHHPQSLIGSLPIRRSQAAHMLGLFPQDGHGILHGGHSVISPLDLISPLSLMPCNLHSSDSGISFRGTHIPTSFSQTTRTRPTQTSVFV